MTDYVKATDFAIKDSLVSGDPDKLLRGSEIDTEFTNIETSIATKADITYVTTTTATIDNKTISGGTF